MSTHTAPVFTKLEGWGMIVCEPCGYVVWPKHMAKHCNLRHGMDQDVATATAAGYEDDNLIKQGRRGRATDIYRNAIPLPARC